MKLVKDFIEISKYAGERIDLVQAGGGNTSVKLDDGRMLIKASGYSLSEVDENKGYSSIDNQKVIEIFKDHKLINLISKSKKETKTTELITKATSPNSPRPSIETSMHSFLLKYVLHTHPVVVNVLLSKKTWKSEIQNLFLSHEFIMVDYKTPGIELAIEIKKQISKLNSVPKIYFLQNHGLIITSDSKEEIIQLNEYVLSIIEKYLKVDFSKYRLTNKVSSYLNLFSQNNNISYQSNDIFLNKILNFNKEIFFKKPFCPDSFVFCGNIAFEIFDFDNYDDLKNYYSAYSSLPKIIIYNNLIFINATCIRKAKEIEEVLKFHIKILSLNKENINFLSDSEINYLKDWESEKFRQNL